VVEFLPQIKFDIAVDRNMVDGVISDTAPAAKAGDIGRKNI
jgi:nitrogen regulatory protein PII